MDKMLHSPRGLPRGVKTATPWATRVRRPTVWLVTRKQATVASAKVSPPEKKVVVGDDSDLFLPKAA